MKNRILSILFILSLIIFSTPIISCDKETPVPEPVEQVTLIQEDVVENEIDNASLTDEQIEALQEDSEQYEIDTTPLTDEQIEALKEESAEIEKEFIPVPLTDEQIKALKKIENKSKKEHKAKE